MQEATSYHFNLLTHCTKYLYRTPYSTNIKKLFIQKTVTKSHLIWIVILISYHPASLTRFPQTLKESVHLICIMGFTSVETRMCSRERTILAINIISINRYTI